LWLGDGAVFVRKKGHSVAVVDNFVRRQWDFELGAQTLTPIQPLTDRLRVWQELTGKSIELFVGDVNDYEFSRASSRVSSRMPWFTLPSSDRLPIR
jgi:UDP-sulfoquinovose synthase